MGMAKHRLQIYYNIKLISIIYYLSFFIFIVPIFKIVETKIVNSKTN